MRGNWIQIVLLGLLAIPLSAATTVAGERYRNYEMADGQYVRFKMTPQEIAAQEASEARRLALRRAAAWKPPKWVVRVELPESGQQLVYPMSSAEIAAAKRRASAAARHKQAAILSNQEQPEGSVTTIEMADGQTVTFRSGREQIGNDQDSGIAWLIKRLTAYGL